MDTVTTLRLPSLASAVLDRLTVTVAVVSRAMWKWLVPSTIALCPAPVAVTDADRDADRDRVAELAHGRIRERDLHRLGAAARDPEVAAAQAEAFVGGSVGTSASRAPCR